MSLVASCSVQMHDERTARVCQVRCKEAPARAEHEGIAVLLMPKFRAGAIGAEDVRREHMELRQRVFYMLIYVRRPQHVFYRCVSAEAGDRRIHLFGRGAAHSLEALVEAGTHDVRFGLPDLLHSTPGIIATAKEVRVGAPPRLWWRSEVLAHRLGLALLARACARAVASCASHGTCQGRRLCGGAISGPRVARCLSDISNSPTL